jgi:hypothetical protein
MCALLQLFESLAGRCSHPELGRGCHICSYTYPCVSYKHKNNTVLHSRYDGVKHIIKERAYLLIGGWTAAGGASEEAITSAQEKPGPVLHLEVL